MNVHNKKETAFERVIFFSDAVIAIALTLLALELKIEIPDSEHLTFAGLFSPWHQYIAFLLSFINIASVWHTHHKFFTHIEKMDEKLIYLNLCWLFFIVILPFATSVLSSHFGDTAAIFLYSCNIFLLSIFQTLIWNYAEDKTDFIHHKNLTERYQRDMRLMLNLDVLNGLIATIVSFFMPKTAFFLLLFKIPIILFIPFLFKRRGIE
jgi:uncharacterized membrane protein